MKYINSRNSTIEEVRIKQNGKLLKLHIVFIIIVVALYFLTFYIRYFSHVVDQNHYVN